MTVIDALQREQALDTRRSFIVQAPAGSGKTGVLTQRILKLLAQVERPEQILAITFTKKAAAEMRTRVAEALQRALAGEVPQSAHERVYYDLASAALARDQEKGWHLLQNLGRLRLQTIDSLCAALVRENLLTAGLGVQFGVEDDASELYLEASRQLLASLDDNSAIAQALFRVLQRFENQFGNVQRLIVQMLEQRDHWLHDVVSAQEDWSSFRALLRQSLQTINEEAFQRVQEYLRSDTLAELEALVTYASNNLQFDQPDHPILKCEPGSLRHRKQQFQLFMTKDSPKWRSRPDKKIGFPPATQGPGGAEADSFKTRAKDLLQRFDAGGDPLLNAVLDFISAPHPDFDADEWQLLEDLVLVVRYAAAHLKVVFQQRHSVDFSEVALAALQALGNVEPTDTQLAMDERIAHILVDEFQDTSFIQIELLEKLTEGWMPGDGRTLFLVGDPMQSIYAFRKADVGLFLKLWHERRLGQVPLETLQLCMNFRSSPAVLDWVNHTFAAVFPRQDDVRTGAVRYAVSRAARTLGEGDCTQVHLFQGPDRDQLTEAEGQWLARQILDIPQHNSIAILVKGKAHILHVAQALRQHGIPYQAVEIESLAESQIILDLLSLYQVCLSPGNRVAWFALLRGPWCGLTLMELEQVAQADPHPWRAIQRLCDEPVQLPPASLERLRHLRRVMAGFYHHRLQQPFVEHLRELALQLGMAATANSRADVDAMELFFGLLAGINEVGGYPDARQLQKKLAKLFVPPEPVAGQRAVQIMTMHKSKGLEFDVVFLPQLHRKSRRDDKPLILVDKQTAQQEQLQELFIAPATPGPKDSNSVYEYLWNIRKQRSANEAARLLYVACTRARQRLYLSACLQVKENRQNPDPASLLCTIWPVFEAQMEVHEIPEADVTVLPAVFRRPRQVVPAVLPVLPADPARPATSSGLEEPAAELPDIHRAAGTLLHRVLEVWTRYPASIPAAVSDAMEQQWQRQLQQEGFDTQESSDAARRIRRALTRLLANAERRHWLLEQRHEDSHTELPLASDGDNGLQHWVVDRTFVENGVRHIIDYKLSEPAGNLQQFLQQETERYRPQLLNYRDILLARDGIPCRTYLYFPLIDHLQEVES